MSEQAYLVEAAYRTRRQHDLYGTLNEAMGKAAFQLEAWILFDNAKQRYDPAHKAHISSLLGEKRYAEALDAWNRHFPAQPVTVHEVAVTKRNCHHDACPTISEGSWYIVETDWAGTGPRARPVRRPELRLELRSLHHYPLAGPVQPGDLEDGLAVAEAWTGRGRD